MILVPNINGAYIYYEAFNPDGLICRRDTVTIEVPQEANRQLYAHAFLPYVYAPFWYHNFLAYPANLYNLSLRVKAGLYPASTDAFLEFTTPQIEYEWDGTERVSLLNPTPIMEALLDAQITELLVPPDPTEPWTLRKFLAWVPSKFYLNEKIQTESAEILTDGHGNEIATSLQEEIDGTFYRRTYQ